MLLWSGAGFTVLKKALLLVFTKPYFLEYSLFSRAAGVAYLWRNYWIELNCLLAQNGKICLFYYIQVQVQFIYIEPFTIKIVSVGTLQRQKPSA